MVKRKENLQGGLNKLAQSLEVLREGKTHQAGSDSVVTIDVYFKLKDGKQIAIEVKSRISDDADILRGIYQCVKYKAVLSAECLAHGENGNVDAFLVIENEMSEENRKTANMLSVKYIVFNKLK